MISGLMFSLEDPKEKGTISFFVCKFINGILSHVNMPIFFFEFSKWIHIWGIVGISWPTINVREKNFFDMKIVKTDN